MILKGLTLLNQPMGTSLEVGRELGENMGMAKTKKNYKIRQKKNWV
jgi:hypothetical protein